MGEAEKASEGLVLRPVRRRFGAAPFADPQDQRQGQAAVALLGAAPVIAESVSVKIHDQRTRQGLSITQTARALGLHPETVSKWSQIAVYRPPVQPKRVSRLDPYKGQIVRWLDEHPLSAQQVFQRLRAAGFIGRISIVKDYVRLIRPPKQKAFLKLEFACGY